MTKQETDNAYLRRRRREDPEWRRRMNVKARERRKRRLREDPEYRARHNERQRAKYRLRRALLRPVDLDAFVESVARGAGATRR